MPRCCVSRRHLQRPHRSLQPLCLVPCLVLCLVPCLGLTVAALFLRRLQLRRVCQSVLRPQLRRCQGQANSAHLRRRRHCQGGSRKRCLLRPCQERRPPRHRHPRRCRSRHALPVLVLPLHRRRRHCQVRVTHSVTHSVTYSVGVCIDLDRIRVMGTLLSTCTRAQPRSCAVSLRRVSCKTRRQRFEQRGNNTLTKSPWAPANPELWCQARSSSINFNTPHNTLPASVIQ